MIRAPEAVSKHTPNTVRGCPGLLCLFIFLVVEVSDLDICIFAVLNGSVYMLQHLLNTATSTNNRVLRSHLVAVYDVLTATEHQQLPFLPGDIQWHKADHAIVIQ